jgi:hypothetical protein
MPDEYTLDEDLPADFDPDALDTAAVPQSELTFEVAADGHEPEPEEAEGEDE